MLAKDSGDNQHDTVVIHPRNPQDTHDISVMVRSRISSASLLLHPGNSRDTHPDTGVWLGTPTALANTKMIITARFASCCPTCSRAVSVGDKVEWSKGTKARHVACSAPTTTTVKATVVKKASNYDSSKFNGYGAPRGGFRKSCVTGGNCSSFGSGNSCGGHDCDGY